MEILAEQLARIIRTPLPAPLTPEIIVVQSRGIERWIAMELAGFNRISANCSFPFPNAFLESVFKKIKLDPATLPVRISIFGISYLPLFHLETFAELSGLIEVNFFLIDPCKEYWADIVSEREIKKIRRRYPRVAENIEWYHFEKGNRLLASMGTLGRDFFELIAGFDCEIHERFEEPETRSVLAYIQSDVLNLRDTERSDITKKFNNSSNIDNNLSAIASSGEAGGIVETVPLSAKIACETVGKIL